MGGAGGEDPGRPRPVARRRGLRAAAAAWWSPPRNLPVLAQVVLAISVLALLGVSVRNLPPAVNGAAYLVGAGQRDTLTAVSHEQACGKCALETIGVLRRTGQRVSWLQVIPLGTSISVRDPVWAPFGATGPNTDMIDGDGDAAGNIILVAGLWAFAGLAAIPVIRIRWLSSRRR
jgi:hypothetical protein